MIMLLGFAGCAAGGPESAAVDGPPGPEALAVDRERCAAEAVLLMGSTPVRDAPEVGAAIIATLPSAQPVFLCDEAGGYRAILFPAPGEPADCADRPPARRCPDGWIDSGAAYDIVG